MDRKQERQECRRVDSQRLEQQGHKNEEVDEQQAAEQHELLRWFYALSPEDVPF